MKKKITESIKIIAGPVAEYVSDNMVQFEAESPERMRTDLVQKGFSKEDVDDFLNQLFGKTAMEKKANIFSVGDKVLVNRGYKDVPGIIIGGDESLYQVKGAEGNMWVQPENLIPVPEGGFAHAPNPDFTWAEAMKKADLTDTQDEDFEGQKRNDFKNKALDFAPQGPKDQSVLDQWKDMNGQPLEVGDRVKASGSWSESGVGTIAGQDSNGFPWVKFNDGTEATMLGMNLVKVAMKKKAEFNVGDQVEIVDGSGVYPLEPWAKNIAIPGAKGILKQVYVDGANVEINGQTVQLPLDGIKTAMKKTAAYLIGSFSSPTANYGINLYADEYDGSHFGAAMTNTDGEELEMIGVPGETEEDAKNYILDAKPGWKFSEGHFVPQPLGNIDREFAPEFSEVNTSFDPGGTGDRSSMAPGSHAAMKKQAVQDMYESIVFMQGEEADEPLKILEEQGEEAALEFLKQWDYGEGGETYNENPAGADDDEYRSGNYIMSYNTRIGTIGLCQVLADNDPLYQNAMKKKADENSYVPPFQVGDQVIFRIDKMNGRWTGYQADWADAGTIGIVTEAPEFGKSGDLGHNMRIDIDGQSVQCDSSWLKKLAMKKKTANYHEGDQIENKNTGRKSYVTEVYTGGDGEERVKISLPEANGFGDFDFSASYILENYIKVGSLKQAKETGIGLAKVASMKISKDWNPEGERLKEETGQDWSAIDANGTNLKEGDQVKALNSNDADGTTLGIQTITGYSYPQIKVVDGSGNVGYVVPSTCVKVASVENESWADGISKTLTASRYTDSVGSLDRSGQMPGYMHIGGPARDMATGNVLDGDGNELNVGDIVKPFDGTQSLGKIISIDEIGRLTIEWNAGGGTGAGPTDEGFRVIKVASKKVTSSLLGHRVMVKKADSIDDQWDQVLNDAPAFKIGDSVEIIGGGSNAGKKGKIVEVGNESFRGGSPSDWIYYVDLEGSYFDGGESTGIGMYNFDELKKVANNRTGMKCKADLQVGDEVIISYEPEKGQTGKIVRIDGDKYYLEEHPGDTPGGAWYHAGDLDKIGSKKKADEDRYKSDAEIESGYDGMKVEEFHWYNEGHSGVIYVTFAGGAEEKTDNFIIYDDGRIAFDNWYPEKIVDELTEYIEAQGSQKSTEFQVGDKVRILMPVPENGGAGRDENTVAEVTKVMDSGKIHVSYTTLSGTPVGSDFDPKWLEKVGMKRSAGSSKYLETFFNEKNLPHEQWEIEGPGGVMNMIDSDVVIEAIMNAPPDEQDGIADMIRRIDFANGNVNDYLKHLAKGLMVTIPSRHVDK